MPILYSGELENCHQLPFHMTGENKTFVFEKDIIRYVCEGREDVYSEQFLSSINFSVFSDTWEGETIFPLIGFINECVNIFDHHVQAEVENVREASESLSYINQRVYPVVLAVAKIGAKVYFEEMAPGETPSMIFEKEMTRRLSE